MEENEVIEMDADLSEEDIAAFDESWDDDFEIREEGEDTDGSEESDESDTDEQPDGADESEGEETDEGTQGETEEPEQPESDEGNQLFTIKYLGNEEKLTLEQMTELAQKGRDYDHLRQERDQLKSESGKSGLSKRQLKFLEDLAKRSNLTVDEQIDRTRAMWLIAEEAKNGVELSEADAIQRVQREYGKTDDAGTPEGEQPQESAVTPQVDRFLKYYPGVLAKDIPQEVWDATREMGGDLLGAYQAWEIRQLKAANEKGKRDALNEKNKERSTGSRRTAGSNLTKDPFEDGWDS